MPKLDSLDIILRNAEQSIKGAETKNMTQTNTKNKMAGQYEVDNMM